MNFDQYDLLTVAKFALTLADIDPNVPWNVAIYVKVDGDFFWRHEIVAALRHRVNEIERAVLPHTLEGHTL